MSTEVQFWTQFGLTVLTVIVGCVTAWNAVKLRGLQQRQTEINAEQFKIAQTQAETAKTQAETGRKKLKIDLFPQRIAVYDTVRATISKALSQGGLSQDDEFAFIGEMRSAKWLFGDEVSEYLQKELWNKMANLGALNAELKDGGYAEDRGALIRQRADIKHALNAQFDELDAKLKPYLRLEH